MIGIKIGIILATVCQVVISKTIDVDYYRENRVESDYNQQDILQSDATNDGLAAAFTKYVYDNNYSGAEMGVLYGDHLVFADGRGFIHGEEASAASLVPILGLSKTITAVAILKLVESGALDLQQKVFGKDGILKEYKPLDGKSQEPRLFDITVQHLLHHTGGWDESVGPVFDPMHNALLVALEYDVVNIGLELGTKTNDDGMPDQYDILTYMLGQPLQFQPGTQVKTSNFGYSVLGRVVEAVTDMPYDLWVKKNILQPAGMWHTRLGPSPTQVQQTMDLQNSSNLERVRAALDGDGNADVPVDLSMTAAMYDVLMPEILDSTLGWYSNIYDAARLFKCLFKSGVNDEFALLLPESLDKAMRRPDAPYPQRSEYWHSLGFKVKEDGSFFMESTDAKQGLDVFFYHRQSKQYNVYNEQNARDAFNFDYPDDSTVIFVGYTYKSHKHMRGLAKAMLTPLTPANSMDNAFVRDLGDNELLRMNHDVMIKYKLEEHHLAAYANAMRMAGYYPTWIHGYNHNGHSYYITLFELASEASQLYYKVFTSTSKRHLIKFMANHVDKQYEVSFLQSFLSSSHGNQMTHVIVISKLTDFRTRRVFDFGQTLEDYFPKLLEQERLGYVPRIQSIDVKNNEVLISFLFETQSTDDNKPRPHSFTDITYDELQSLTADNANIGYSLSYLDAFTAYGEQRFSAVYQYGLYDQWLLQNDVTYERLTSEAEKWNGQDYKPKLMVAFHRDGELRYAGLWINDEKISKDEKKRK